MYVVTVGVEFPFMNNAYYVGPVANSLGGADIAWIVGFVFAAVVYWVGARFGLATPTRGGHAKAKALSGDRTG